MGNQADTNTQGIEYPSHERISKRLYTVRETGHYLGLTVWAIRELYYGGKLPCVRNGRKMLFDIEDLNGWIDRNKHQNKT